MEKQVSFGRIPRRSSLAQLDRQLPLRLRHLSPQSLQVLLQRLVIGLLSQGQGKPTIGCGEIARRTYSRRVERAQRNHCAWIGLLGCGPQHSKSSIAVLPLSASIDVFFALGDLIKHRGRGGLRCRWRSGGAFGSWCWLCRLLIRIGLGGIRSGGRFVFCGSLRCGLVCRQRIPGGRSRRIRRSRGIASSGAPRVGARGVCSRRACVGRTRTRLGICARNSRGLRGCWL